MPIQLQQEPTDRLLRTTATGVVTVSEFESYLADVHRHGRHDVPELIDATAADISGFSQRDILALADYARRMFNENTMARRALVVASDETLGAARAFAFCVAGWWRVGVFEDRATAETWVRES